MHWRRGVKKHTQRLAREKKEERNTNVRYNVQKFFDERSKHNDVDSNTATTPDENDEDFWVKQPRTSELQKIGEVAKFDACVGCVCAFRAHPCANVLTVLLTIQIKRKPFSSTILRYMRINHIIHQQTLSSGYYFFFLCSNTKSYNVSEFATKMKIRIVFLVHRPCRGLWIARAQWLFCDGVLSVWSHGIIYGFIVCATTGIPIHFISWALLSYEIRLL